VASGSGLDAPDWPVALPPRPPAEEPVARPRPEPPPHVPPPEVEPPRREPPPAWEGEDGFDEEPAAGSRFGTVFGAMAGLGCLVVVLGGAVAGVLFGLDVGGMRSMTADVLGGSGPEEAQTSAPVPPPGATEPSEPPVAPSGPSMTFLSAAEGTRKLNVTCTEGRGKGERSAVVAAASAERCTVTAILEDRSRLVAVVGGARAGEYRCFENAEATCRRQ
jgi:hypothetical protein